MTHTLSNPLKEWNPQLLRELKGRLKPLNISIAIAISLIAQFVIVDSLEYDWFNIFIVLSLSAMTAILAFGTFMLISDLDQEERRGTLDFIRLTPQSGTHLFIGKLLGVPCILYLAVALAIPLQLWSGLLSGFNLVETLGFDIILILRSVFVLSLALLFGLVKGNLSGLKPWLASAFVLFCLFVFMVIFPHSPTLNNAWDAIKIFSPSPLLPYFLSESPQQQIFDRSAEYYITELQSLRWFYLPIGANVVSLSLFYLVNYLAWTRLTWQGINRLFQNPTATIISKRQSYIITAAFTLLSLGFSLKNFGLINYILLISQSILVFFALIAALLPNRLTLQDWLQDYPVKLKNKQDFISDLIWGEKSPAILAIAINLTIISVPTGLITLFSVNSFDEQCRILLGLFLNASFILLCASLAQLLLLMKTKRRALWTTGILSALIILPPILFSIFQLYPHQSTMFFLFSALFFIAIKEAAIPSLIVVFIGQALILTVLNQQFVRQLKMMRKSRSKTLAS
ncbi:hypothetical protein ACL6C3_07825 [Capilliphycus salinus ALCB114379]|uniref:hypothetical protein n=1 Tax=Capilliphycus salinus TaxID=2768948 RepID=UPI0039A4881E